MNSCGSKAICDQSALEQSVNHFEEKSGIKIDRYDGGYLGEMFKEFCANKAKYNNLCRQALFIDREIKRLSGITASILEVSDND
ncbi:MAG: hypothetical protein JEZ07_19815 [Phycisphaerae bacterium]|nr:hypothetical protein [Phycisphaerae bacterium]